MISEKVAQMMGVGRRGCPPGARLCGGVLADQHDDAHAANPALGDDKPGVLCGGLEEDGGQVHGS
jgi:hypothetical protein